MSMRRENYIEESDEESEEDDKEQLCVWMETVANFSTWKGQCVAIISKQLLTLGQQFLFSQNEIPWVKEK